MNKDGRPVSHFMNFIFFIHQQRFCKNVPNLFFSPRIVCLFLVFVYVVVLTLEDEHVPLFYFESEEESSFLIILFHSVRSFIKVGDAQETVKQHACQGAGPPSD